MKYVANNFAAAAASLGEASCPWGPSLTGSETAYSGAPQEEDVLACETGDPVSSEVELDDESVLSRL